MSNFISLKARGRNKLFWSGSNWIQYFRAASHKRSTPDGTFLMQLRAVRSRKVNRISRELLTN